MKTKTMMLLGLFLFLLGLTPMTAFAAPGVSYRSYVNGTGWQSYVSNGAISGSTGEGKRIEALSVKLLGASGGIKYRTHVQGKGWGSWVANGSNSGFPGKSLRVEAFQMELTGNAASSYSIWYRVHVQKFGWLGWTSDGQTAGTTGCSLRIEAIQIKLMGKNDKSLLSKDLLGSIQAPTLRYAAHVQNIGWQDYVQNGQTAGTTGKSKRLEKLIIDTNDSSKYASNCFYGLAYRAKVQNTGWSSWVRENKQGVGTTGKGLALEALEIKLTGNNAEIFNVCYRVHVKGKGWLKWVKNGATAGSGTSQIEAVQIKLEPKN
ncbi:MAG: hypothetical protein Q4A32_11675 [Lachnospiraceae bacterium]|nr:hypothetical protein [Lachnospiraceae bacterium]